MRIKRTIVVVDDNKNQTALLDEFLKANGFDVRIAHTGNDGLQRVLDYKADLVILDYVLPDISGPDVCTQLRASAATKHIPIILCSAHKITAVDKIRGFRAGADDYLIRPFDLSELLARIDAIFRRTTLQPREDILAGIKAVVDQAPVFKPGPKAAEPSKVSTLPPRQYVSSRPKSSPKAPSILKRLWDVLNNPLHVFTMLDEQEDFFIGTILVLASPVVASLSKLFQQTGGFDSWIGGFSLGVVLHALLWLGTGGVLHMVLPFQGINMPMKRALTIAGLSWAPRLINSVLGLTYELIATAALAGENFSFSSGLDMLPGLSSNGMLTLVSRISLFDAWSIWLTLVGVWTYYGPGERRWNSVTVIVGGTCLLFGALTNF